MFKSIVNNPLVFVISLVLILQACSSAQEPATQIALEKTFQLEWANPKPQGNRLSDLVWANSKFVAVGDNGTIMSSADGVNWSSYNLPFRENFFHIQWNSALSEYIVVGERLLQSPTAEAGSWTDFDDGYIKDVCWDGNRYVGIGSSSGAGGYVNYFYTSDAEGKNWQSVINPNLSNAEIRSIECNPGADIPYVVSGYSFDVETKNFLATSTNGMDWTIRVKLGGFSHLKRINGKFHAIGSLYSTSVDGVTWTAPESLGGTILDVVDTGTDTVLVGDNIRSKKPMDATWTQQARINWILLRGIQWDGSHFVVVGDDGEIRRFTIAADNSMDSNTIVEFGGAIDFRAVAGNGKGLYVVAGNTVMTSTDGLNWVDSAVLNGAALKLKYDSVTDLFIACTSNIISTSQDGKTWTDLNFTGSEVQSIAWNDDRTRYVAISRNVAQGLAVVWTSTDLNPASTWTDQVLEMPAGVSVVEPREIIWDGGQFIIVGNPGVIYRSADGLKWSMQRNTTEWPGGLNGLASDGTQLLAGGSGRNSGIIRSLNGGDTWEPVFSGDTSRLAWTGSAFISLEKYGLLGISSNGTDWESLPSPTNYIFMSDLYGDSNMILMVGSGGKIIRVTEQ